MKTATEKKAIFSGGSVCHERLLRSWFFFCALHSILCRGGTV